MKGPAKHLGLGISDPDPLGGTRRQADPGCPGCLKAELRQVYRAGRPTFMGGDRAVRFLINRMVSLPDESMTIFVDWQPPR